MRHAEIDPKAKRTGITVRVPFVWIASGWRWTKAKAKRALIWALSSGR